MGDIIFKDVLDDLIDLIDDRSDALIKNILPDLHPADISELFRALNKDERTYLYQLLEKDQANEVFAELDENIQEDLIEEFDLERITDLVENLETDDAADIISELPEEQASEVLDNIEEEHSEEIRELLSYDEESAGGIMAKEFIAINDKATVTEAVELIREEEEDIEELYHLYVTDDYGKYLGAVSLRDLVLAFPDQKMSEIMDQDYPFVEVDQDQEDVAHMFKKYDLVSLPVIDDRHNLIGHVSIDDIVDIIQEETEEDISYIAGTSEDDIHEESFWKISKARIPWLMVAFVGEIVSALILSKFNATIQAITASAFFIPVIMAMGGATGQQTGIIVVHGLVTGSFSMKNIARRVFTEIKSALLTSTVFAVITIGFVYLWMGDMALGIILGLSILIVITLAGLIGSIIPAVFKRLNIDPALVTGPLIATSNDILGLLIYFSFLTFAYKFFL